MRGKSKSVWCRCRSWPSPSILQESTSLGGRIERSSGLKLLRNGGERVLFVLSFSGKKKGINTPPPNLPVGAFSVSPGSTGRRPVVPAVASSAGSTQHLESWQGQISLAVLPHHAR